MSVIPSNRLEQERAAFEVVAKKMNMSLTRNARKPDEYAFNTQKAWTAWMIRATMPVPLGDTNGN